jgi:ribosomal protein S18 acetylase RimI-like enzyme
MLESPTPALYISTLSLLSPYRSYGIATHLLQRVTVKAVQEHDARSVMAHVWEKNDEGLEWYKKRGFEVVGKEEAYYRKLRPAGAMLVQKRVAVGDFLGMDCDSARS